LQFEPVAVKLRIIYIVAIIAFGCRSQPKPWQTLDLGGFSVKTPDGWSIVKKQGVDSYFGGLTDGRDSIWFDYGLYEVDLDGDSVFWYRLALDTVNGFRVLFTLPDKCEKGQVAMKISMMPESRRFTIWASNVKDSATIIQIYKSVLFAHRNPYRSAPVVYPHYFERTDVNGKVLFRELCQACHSMQRHVDGPRLRDLMEVRSADWIFRFFTDRKEMQNDRFHQQMKREFDNRECPEFKNLTKEQAVALEYYIESQP
jgi:hypothetical protein